MIEFETLFDWALLPHLAKSRLPSRSPMAVDHIGENGFRWLRAGRQARKCAPYVLATELGWYLRSPVDVTLPCLPQVPFDPDDQPMEEVARRLALKEVWDRGDHAIGLPAETGLRRFDIDQGTHGEPMFLSNGEKSWEWRLGLSVRCDPDLALLVLSPPETDGAIVPAILLGKTLNRIGGSTGLSVAIRPRRELQFRRGDDIAWLVPLPREAILNRLPTDDET